MPFVPHIRKDILKALDENIIPALWKQQVPLGYVSPPLLFPASIKTHLLTANLPRSAAKSPGFPIKTIWPKAKLHATVHPYLSFIYEGTAREHTLLSVAQSKQYNLSKGIYSIEWQAPGALLFPPGMPRNTGSNKYFRDDSPFQHPTVKILQIAFRDTILVHLRNESATEVESSHSLQINDAVLLTLGNVFQKELQHTLTIGQDTAQAALLTLMLRLRDHLSSHQPSLANTAYPHVIKSASPNEHTQEICQLTVHYIQAHLRENLSLPSIARKMQLSPTHLNRLFRQFSGVPVMRYVKQQRIAAAKKILELGTENIAEIATLVGFTSSTVFCRVFRRETSMTPTQYRRQIKRAESTFR